MIGQENETAYKQTKYILWLCLKVSPDQLLSPVLYNYIKKSNFQTTTIHLLFNWTIALHNLGHEKHDATFKSFIATFKTWFQCCKTKLCAAGILAVTSCHLLQSSCWAISQLQAVLGAQILIALICYLTWKPLCTPRMLSLVFKLHKDKKGILVLLLHRLSPELCWSWKKAHFHSPWTPMLLSIWEHRVPCCWAIQKSTMFSGHPWAF